MIKTPHFCTEGGRRGGGGGSSDSSTDDARDKNKQAAAARDGGGTAGAHILRARHTRAVRRRNGRPLSSLVNSFLWLIRIAWPSDVRWSGFMVRRHATAYPWAEATRVASRRTVGAWDTETLCRILGLES